jgi:hypothetical protein
MARRIFDKHDGDELGIEHRLVGAALDHRSGRLRGRLTAPARTSTRRASGGRAHDRRGVEHEWHR